MENEGNRGLIHKKASKDRLVTFCQFSFGELSLFSFSLSPLDTEFSWCTLALDQERQRRKEEAKIK